MVEYFVTKGNLAVRNGEPFVVIDGKEKAMSKIEFILWTSLHWNLKNAQDKELYSFYSPLPRRNGLCSVPIFLCRKISHTRRRSSSFAKGTLGSPVRG